MVISKNNQLGLQLWDHEMMREFLKDYENLCKRELKSIQDVRQYLKDESNGLHDKITNRLGYNPQLKGSEFYTIKHPNPYYYLIQPSVHYCAEMIKINDDFSCLIFKKIKDGEHIYLLGKSEYYRFLKFNNVIKASFWSREKHVAFEMGFDLEEDKYYYPSIAKQEFNRLLRLMIFIELGDIETTIIEKGKNNGKPKKDGKITNTSDSTVYVVDSSWNKLIIRTEGFAVRGHFRLQPCGEELKNRKLIWIDAFEKNGYVRKPKSEIIKEIAVKAH